MAACPDNLVPLAYANYGREFQEDRWLGIYLGVKPEAVLWASRGTFSYTFTEAVPDGVAGHWRAQFDLTAAGNDPVDMRLYLKNGDKILSETWLYQYFYRS